MPMHVFKPVSGSRAATLAFALVMALTFSARASDETQLQNLLSKEELDAGWVQLFDGESLFGWSADGKADWKVEEGAIRVDEGEVCLLHSHVQFGDFEFKCDFKAAADANSGVFLRTSHKPKDVVKDCYELNIAAPSVSPFPTGSFVGRAKSSAEMQTFDYNAWHSFHVIAQGGTWKVFLDGQSVLDYQDANPKPRGYLSLQHNQGSAAFRNIKVKPIGLHSLLQGMDLAGWREFPGKTAKFTRSNSGDLAIQGGPGQLETVAQFADFALQTEVFVNGEGLNSGIFFRCIPGQYSNGYESQIQNAFKDGDRTQPVDFGTGAIYRRVKARRVVSNDKTWFHKTILAEGPRIAVWVEGFPVTAWIDERPANANPREGLRTESGTIVLQAHDPGTDLLFRNMSIGEIAPLPGSGATEPSPQPSQSGN